jgi:hypothetical protein
MPIKTEWHNTEKTILYVTYQDNWTLEEYLENVTFNAQVIREQVHNVVTVADFTENHAIPGRFMSSGQYSEKTIPDNNMGMVLFGLNSYMVMMAKIFARVFPKLTTGMVIASNQEEALQFAQNILNDLPGNPLQNTKSNN